MSFNKFHPNLKLLFNCYDILIHVLTFFTQDLISTASNLRSDTGLRSWLAFLNSDNRDFAFIKRKKIIHVRKKWCDKLYYSLMYKVSNSTIQNRTTIIYACYL